MGRNSVVSVRIAALACACLNLLIACKSDKVIAVSRFVDGGAGSLRAAIHAANATRPDDAASVIIELPAGNYELRSCGNDETNATGDLDVLTNLPVTLIATGNGVVIRQTCAGERVLDAYGSGRLTLKGVTLTGGGVVGSDETVPATGGALRARNDVRLERVTITRNTVTGAAAEPSSFPVLATPGGGARGGGLFVGGALSVVDSVVSENQALGGSGPTLADGSAPPLAGAAEGGGIYVAGALEIVRSTFSNNVARGGVGTVGGGGQARGGAAAGATSVTSSNSTYSSNQAESGNSVYSPSGIPGQPPSCTGEPPARATGGAVWSAANLTSRTDRFSENVSKQGGGCDVYMTTISMPPIPPHWPGGNIQYPVAFVPPLSSGGGLAGGSVSAVGSEFVGNRIENGYGSALSAALDATLDAVILRDNRENAGALGHAVDVTGALSLTSSVLTGNTNGVRAGSLQARSVTIADTTKIAVESAGEVSLVNTTLSGIGPAVRAGRLSLSHCTITRDYDEIADGPLLQADSMETHGSIVVGSPICAAMPVGPSSYNWFSESCGLSGVQDRQAELPLLLGLQPLADNGGPVPTRALAPSSLLRDAVPNSACTVTNDARGTARPQGTACDIGAYEAPAIAGVGPTDLSVAFINPPSFVAPGTRGTWTLRVRNKGPAASVPVVRLSSIWSGGPEVTAVSISATGATCTMDWEVICTYNAPLAAGASATITFVGSVPIDRQTGVAQEAQVYAARLRAPFEDDTATLVTRTSAGAGLSLQLQNNRYYNIGFDTVPSPTASVFNSLLTDAIASPDRPIRIELQPAPGVQALPVDFSTELFDERTSPLPANSSALGLSFYFPISELRTPLLGTLKLDPGDNPLAGPASMPLYNADLTVRAERAAGPQAPGAAVPFSAEVLNQGPGRAENVMVWVGWNGSESVMTTWSVSRGGVSPGAPGQFIWNIPALASGESAVLTGSAPYNLEGTTLGLYSRSSSIEFDPDDNNESLNLTAAPEGTMDLYLSDIRVLPGATPEQRVLRATVRNAGPAAAQATWDDPILVSLEQRRNGSFANRLVALDSGWTCDNYTCQRSEPFAAGATATFEWTLDDRFRSPDGLLGAVVSARLAPADARPSNNLRFIPAP